MELDEATGPHPPDQYGLGASADDAADAGSDAGAIPGFVGSSETDAGAAGGGPSRTQPSSPRPKRKRWITVLAIVVPVLLVGGAAYWWFEIRSSGPSTAAPATTRQLVTVTSGNISNTVEAEGTIAAANTDNLNFSSAGTVTAVNVAAGDKVTAGQVLATIDSAALDANVAKAQANLDSANAKLSDDQSASASDQQIAADQSNVQVDQDALTAAQAAQAGANLTAGIAGTVTQVNLTAGEQLSSSGAGGTSLAGSGTGSGRNGTTGGTGGTGAAGGNNSSSSSSTAQIQIVSTGQFTVSLPIGSTDINNVAVGQPVSMVVSTSSSSNINAGGFGGIRAAFGGNGGAGAFPGGGAGGSGGNGGAGAFPGGGNGGGAGGGGGRGTGVQSALGTTASGTVSAVSKVATASSGVASYPVTVSFTGDPTKLFIGSSVTATITTGTRSNVVLVSQFAVTTTGNRSTVEVATDGTATGPVETRTVTTGATSGGNIEIVSGLKAGDKVVVEIPAAFANRGEGGAFTRGGLGGGGNRTGGQGTGGQGTGGQGGFGGQRTNSPGGANAPTGGNGPAGNAPAGANAPTGAGG